jgi:hypothetical protein
MLDFFPLIRCSALPRFSRGIITVGHRLQSVSASFQVLGADKILTLIAHTLLIGTRAE